MKMAHIEDVDYVENEHEEPTPYTLVQSDLSPENTREVQTISSSYLNSIDDFISYKLLFRHNRGKPLNRYSPDHEEKV